MTLQNHVQTVLPHDPSSPKASSIILVPVTPSTPLHSTPPHCHPSLPFMDSYIFESLLHYSYLADLRKNNEGLTLYIKFY